MLFLCLECLCLVCPLGNVLQKFTPHVSASPIKPPLTPQADSETFFSVADTVLYLGLYLSA